MADNNTRIIISAEDRTSAAMRSAQANLAGLSGAYSRLAGVIGGAGVAGGVIAMAKSAIDAGDELNKLSQKTGITVESLSALKYAGELSDVSLESLAQGVKKLSVNMLDVANGGGGEAAEAFKAIGVRVTEANGAMRSSETVLLDVAEKFSAMQDGAEKTALAIKIFGKSGADLIPFLNQGASGISGLREEAERLGIVISTDFARDAEKFNDALTKMSKNSSALGIALTKDLIGPMANFLELINKVGTGGAIFATLDRTMAGGDLNKRIAEVQKQVDEANKNFQDGSKYNPMTNVWGARAVALEQQLAGLKALAEDADKAAAAIGPPASAMGSGRRTGGATDGGKVAKVSSVSDYADKINRMVAGAIDDSDVVKAQEYADALAQLDSLYFNSGLDAEVYSSAVDKLSKSTSSASKESSRLKEMLDATPTAKLEEARADMQLLAEAMQKGLRGEVGGITSEQYLEAVQTRLGTVGETIKENTDFAREFGLTFSSAFEDAIVGGKQFSEVLKGLAQDLARIVIRKTITEKAGNAISGAIDSSGIGDFFSSLFGGFRAGGGAIDAGKFYMVGERGPELLYAGSSGTVVPNHALGGGGGVVVNLIEAPGKGGQVSQSNKNGVNTLDIMVEQIANKIAGDIGRGNGSVPASMERAYGLTRAAGAY